MEAAGSTGIAPTEVVNAPATSPADTTVPSRRLWGEPLGRLLAVCLALFAVAAAIVVPAALRETGLSPFDEPTHVDYAYQVAHGRVPERGSVIAPVLREEIACRALANRPDPAQLKLCGVPNPAPEKFTVNAQNYNFGHPPLYYLITGVLARAANSATSGHHFITAARLVGLLWLFAAMVVLYVALRMFRVRWPLAFCGGLLLALTPTVFYSTSTVTNDAAAPLAGSLALLVLARILVRGKLGWLLPSLLALLAAATKILNALPFLATAAVLAAVAIVNWRTDRAKARQLIFGAVGMIVGVLVVYAGWTYFQHHRGDPNWVNPIASISGRRIHGEPFDELFGRSFSSIGLLSSGWLPGKYSNAWMDALQRLWGPLGTAAAAVLLALHNRWAPRFNVALTTIVGILAFPLLVEIQVWRSSNQFFPVVVPRYGFSMIPLLLAAIAMVADDRRLTKWLYGFTGAVFLIALYTVLG